MSAWDNDRVNTHTTRKEVCVDVINTQPPTHLHTFTTPSSISSCPQRKLLTGSEAMVWPSNGPLPWAPVIPPGRGLDRSSWLWDSGRCLGLHGGCRCGGPSRGDSSRSMSWPWVGGPVTAVAAPTFFDGTAWGHLFTVRRRCEPAGASRGGGRRCPSHSGANAIVKVGDAVALSISGAAISRMVCWRPWSSPWHWGSPICSQRGGGRHHYCGRGDWRCSGSEDIWPFRHGTGFGEEYGVLPNTTFSIHKICWDIILDRAHHNPLQEHKT